MSPLKVNAAETAVPPSTLNVPVTSPVKVIDCAVSNADAVVQLLDICAGRIESLITTFVPVNSPGVSPVDLVNVNIASFSPVPLRPNI